MFFKNLFLFMCVFTTSYSLENTKVYKIEEFLNTNTLADAIFSYDEKKVLFSSDQGGIFNIYEIDTFGSALKQLTHSDSQAFHVLSGFPHDERFLYTYDELGNERHHIFLFDNGKTKDLTPYPGAKSNFEGWSHDQKSFFFTSNVRDPKIMDLYEMDIASFTPILLYQNEGDLLFGCISSDKQYLAFHKVLSANNTNLYLYDLREKKLTHITPHEGEIKCSAAAFSLDSKSLYLTTDENSEFVYLQKFDIESGQFKTVEKYDWDIVSCEFSRNHKYRVTEVNEDGKTAFHIYDEQNQKIVKLCSTNVTRVCMSNSEKSILLFVGGGCIPNDLYIYNFEDGSCRKLAHSLSPDIDPNDLVEGEIIRFSSYDTTLIPAFYYKPHSIPVGQKIPALIWVHGGPGGQSRFNYNYLIQYLVNHGYAILAINNRGSSGYGKTFYQAADLKTGHADLDDCIWAKKFLSETGYIDESKIGIIGGSYGGYMVLAALAFRPDEMAVGVDIFGVSNWVRTLKSIPTWWEVEKAALYKKIGNPETATDYLTSISPLFHAENITKPLLVIQGANDPRVLKVESDEIIDRLSRNNTPYRYVVFDDEGHGFSKKKNKQTAGIAVLEFLDEHLKKN